MKKGFGKYRALVAGLVGGLFVLSGSFALGYHGADALPGKERPVASVGNTEWKESPQQVPEKPKDKAGKTQPPAAAKPAVLDPAAVYRIVVDKSEHRFYLYQGDTLVRDWPCAVGRGGLGQKQRRGDNMTPVGTFRVDEIDDASTWTHDFGDGNGEIAGAYGPWFLSLDTEALSGGRWDGIGIHGTHDPASLGTDASEGCVRLANKNLEELHRIARVGMTVEIRD